MSYSPATDLARAFELDNKIQDLRKELDACVKRMHDDEIGNKLLEGVLDGYPEIKQSVRHLMFHGKIEASVEIEASAEAKTVVAAEAPAETKAPSGAFEQEFPALTEVAKAEAPAKADQWLKVVEKASNKPAPPTAMEEVMANSIPLRDLNLALAFIRKYAGDVNMNMFGKCLETCSTPTSKICKSLVDENAHCGNYVPCKSCEGSGKYQGKRDCTKCDGTGTFVLFGKYKKCYFSHAEKPTSLTNSEDENNQEYYGVAGLQSQSFDKKTSFAFTNLSKWANEDEEQIDARYEAVLAAFERVLIANQ